MPTKTYRIIHGLKIYPNKYTRKQKRCMSSKIKPVTDEEAISEFVKLQNYDLDHIGLSRVGNKTVDKYTYSERLNTVGNKGISFYDFYYNSSKFKTKRYVNNIFNYCGEQETKKRIKREVKKGKTAETATGGVVEEEGACGIFPDLKVWVAIFNMYFGSVNIFRPLVSAKIYEIFKPTSILDFTMGWGGRMVGAMALNVKKYTGIDNNKNLQNPYKNMVTLLKPHTDTRVKLMFKNALDVDYSKLEYDMVLTSPPYYDIEVYGNADIAELYKTRGDWNDLFYRPLFSRTYAGLKRGGYYCLNIPELLYESVCVPLFGAADTTLFFDKKMRPNNYREFIYVWKK